MYSLRCAPHRRRVYGVELASYLGYSQLDEQLRQLGFQNDMMSGVICRYRLPTLLIDVVESIRVDIMPTNPAVLGFSNRWYGEGYERAVPYALDEQTTIKLSPLAYFVASKLEAVAGRGGHDLRFSTDFEDIVLDNAPDVLAQLRSESNAVLTYLRQTFGQLLSRPDLVSRARTKNKKSYTAPTLEEIKQKQAAEADPVKPLDELLYVYGGCVWAVFSNNHEVTGPTGEVFGLGSFRGTGSTIANFLNAVYPDGPTFDYMDFYCANGLVERRADVSPIYALIFRRLK